MYKSRLFIIYNYNLEHDISNVELSGRKIKELQCNDLTMRVWLSLYEEVRRFSTTTGRFERDTGLVGSYKGVPIRINNTLDNGTIGIEVE